MSSTMRLNSDEAKTYQGFGKRTTSITKVSAPPGGHTQFNLFSEEAAKPIAHEVKPCQYERNKSSITDQYTGTECKESPEKKPAPTVQTQVTQHATPPKSAKHTSTRIIQPPGGASSLNLFG